MAALANPNPNVNASPAPRSEFEGLEGLEGLVETKSIYMEHTQDKSGNHITLITYGDEEPQVVKSTIYQSKKFAKKMEQRNSGDSAITEVNNSLGSYVEHMQKAKHNPTTRRRLYKWFTDRIGTNFDDEMKQNAIVIEKPTMTFATCGKHLQARLVFFQSLFKKLAMYSTIRQKLDDYCYENIIYVFYKREGDSHRFICHETNNEVFLCIYEKKRRHWTISTVGRNCILVPPDAMPSDLASP